MIRHIYDFEKDVGFHKKVGISEVVDHALQNQVDVLAVISSGNYVKSVCDEVSRRGLENRLGVVNLVAQKRDISSWAQEIEIEPNLILRDEAERARFILQTPEFVDKQHLKVHDYTDFMSSAIGERADKSKKTRESYIELPYCVKGMDLQFGGILTNLRQKLEKTQASNNKEYPIEDLCYSAQETVFAMLTEVTERALAHCNKSEVILGGGVACNKRLQEMMRIMCEERGAKAHFIENQYYVDNAAMIAWLGILEYSHGKRMTVEESNIEPYLRTDDIDVHWRDEKN